MSVLEIIIFALIKIVIIVSAMLLSVAYLVYFERKVSAWAQNRIGPNRVGWKGALQPFADLMKLALKEDIVPQNADKRIHSLAPVIALLVALSTYAVIPFGPDLQIANYNIPLIVADVNIGVLFILALTSLGVYAITLAGWSSGSKYSLLGGIRSSAQMISYEVSMGFSVAGVLLLSESLRPTAIVESQASWMWNAIVQPIGFITFLVSAFAETNRLPFDLPEAEPELVGGFHTEYSSMKFAGFFLAEYANMIIASALIVTLYLGGWQIPYLEKLNLSPLVYTLLSLGAFLLKMAALLFFFLWIRWTLPRFRYDQLMNLGWKVLFPLSLINIVWVAVLIMSVLAFLLAGDNIDLGNYRYLILLSAVLLSVGLISVQIRPLAYFFLGIIARLPLVKRIHQPWVDFYESSREILQLRHVIPTSTLGALAHMTDALGFCIILHGFGLEITWVLYLQAVFITGLTAAIGALSGAHGIQYAAPGSTAFKA